MIEFLIADVTDEAMLNALWNISQVMLYAICIIGSVIFAIVRGRRKLEGAQIQLDTSSKLSAYFVNVPMIFAIIIMLYITAQFWRLKRRGLALATLSFLPGLDFSSVGKN